MIFVRSELSEDSTSIRRINEASFSQSLQADLVDRLRYQEKILLSLVAVSERKTVGHILFTPVIINERGAFVEAVELASMAVLPEFRGKGIGSAMMRTSLKELRKRAYPFIIVSGPSSYYSGFGFKPAGDYGLSVQWQGRADKDFLVLSLKKFQRQKATENIEYRERTCNML